MRYLKNVGIVLQYGSDNTHLILSDKAERVYFNTIPLIIFEFEDSDDPEKPEYWYFIRGFTNMDHLTQGEVNDWLEAMYNEEDFDD